MFIFKLGILSSNPISILWNICKYTCEVESKRERKRERDRDEREREGFSFGWINGRSPTTLTMDHIEEEVLNQDAEWESQILFPGFHCCVIVI